jgi:hypothetical protein
MASEGFDQDVRTPFWDERPRAEIITLFERMVGSSGIPELDFIDEDEKLKVGPLSLMPPYDERREKVLEYWHQEFKGDLQLLLVAVSKVSALIPQHSIRPLGWQGAFDHVKKNKNWGLPTASSDPGVASWYFESAQRLTSPDQIYPHLLFGRTQQAGPDKSKPRTVFGQSKVPSICENRFMYPILNTLASKLGFSAWGTLDDVDAAVTKLIDMARSSNVPIMSGDYSGFDSSVPGEVIDAVWMGTIDQWVVPGYESLLEILRVAFKTVPLVVPWEVLPHRTGGIPSGSVFTNLIDSLINLVAGHYIALRLGTELRGFEVMGDDSLFLFGRELEPEDLANAVSEIGLTMSPEKQFIHDEGVHYLQRLHLNTYRVNGMCVGIHCVFRSLSGLTGMEHWRDESDGWNEYLASARGICQVENCKNDPRFPKIVEAYYIGDKLVREMDPVMIFSKAGGADIVRDALDKGSFTYNVYDPSLASAFKTVEIIRGLQSN